MWCRDAAVVGLLALTAPAVLAADPDAKPDKLGTVIGIDLGTTCASNMAT
jgi:hypothetical protein